MSWLYPPRDNIFPERKRKGRTSILSDIGGDKDPGRFPLSPFALVHPPTYCLNATPTEVMEMLRRETIPEVDMVSLTRDLPPSSHSETRADLLQGVKYDGSRSIIWLTGPAGCGKSTIARAIAEQCMEDDRFGVALSFSSTSQHYDISRVFHTIAYQLALRDQFYQDFATWYLIHDPRFLQEPTREDFRYLFVDVCSVQVEPPERRCIILDGLDECWDDVAQLKLLELIDSSMDTSTPSYFTWVICTRPSPPLRQFFAQFNGHVVMGHGTVIELSVNDTQSIQNVTRFLRDGFSDICKRYSIGSELQVWPTEAQITRLEQVTLGYFPCASCILQFVGDKERGDPVAQLLALLDFLDNPHLSITIPFHSLDEMYLRVLSKVRKDVLATTLKILRFCTSNPGRLCTFRTLQFVFSLSPEQILEALCDLHSVVGIPIPPHSDSFYFPEWVENKGPYLYHPSFAEFLRNPNRSGEFTTKQDLQGVRMLKGVGVSAALSTTPTPGVVVADTAGSSDSHLPKTSTGRHLGLSRFVLNRLSKASAPVVGQVANPQQTHVNPPAENRSPRLNPPPLDAANNDFEITTSLLSQVLKTSRSRKALLNLKGDRAQLMVNYLHSVLLEPSTPVHWLQKHSLIALRELSRDSLVYPHCYALKDIIFDSHEGGGAFSDIYKGRHGERHLCLKVVRLHQKSDTEAMLKIYAKEAILWGQLDHPNVVPLYGIFYLNEARKQVCLVSPWMRRGNLVDYLRNNPSAPRHLLIYDVVAGLDYLHTQSLVHSDIKGMNILVNDYERACITDFGLSFIRTDQTLAYTFASSSAHGFSHHWASPELLEDGARPTLASDVWALGCVFYEVLTGSLPYGTASDAQIIRRLMRGELPTKPHPPPSSGSAEDTIWKLADRCWALEPTDRPTCQDISQALKRERLAREGEESLGDAAQRSQDFQNAMRKNEDVPLDRGQVEQILDELCTGTAQLATEE